MEWRRHESPVEDQTATVMVMPPRRPNDEEKEAEYTQP
ncbi:hypothetical protein PF008_g15720 [Phytophthora fragariae]|uniref:Uncharacterized protein n=2 Tax=Phytophthora TaxID=4783 RepID=A0A6A3L7V1_9STRA|nr:hypothetical protein PR002_g14320 [Phytophthora rubi]KAE9330481.1 hypothetical protein PF008_g15720 [Phytophthora fragariae]